MAKATLMPLPEVKMPEILQQKDDKFSKAEAEMCFCGFFSCFKKKKPKVLPIKRVNAKINPYRKVGKLYYTRNGRKFFCTAQFVGAPNILLTSAHCLKESGGAWSTNLLFVRAAHKKAGEQKVKVAVSAASFNKQWDENPLAEHHTKWDYGFAKTILDSNVGYLNLSLQLTLKIRLIGYPCNYGKSGKYMCEAYGIQ